MKNVKENVKDFEVVSKEVIFAKDVVCNDERCQMDCVKMEDHNAAIENLDEIDVYDDVCDYIKVSFAYNVKRMERENENSVGNGMALEIYLDSLTVEV